MFCCPNCFTHTFIKNYIKTYSKQNGKCSFCSHKGNSPLFQPELLIDLFQPLFDLYQEGTKGLSLNELLQKDWNIFSKHIDDNKQLQLISKIAADNNLLNKLFIAKLVRNKNFIHLWDDFSNELKYENRFFPKKIINIDQFSKLFKYLIILKNEIPKYVYRARKNHQSELLTISDMGKPPVDNTIDGRANPKGISYFYTASNEKTVIAEIRPYKTESICVAKFQVNPDVSLFDLRAPKSTISPFGLDGESLSYLYEYMPFLIHLGDVLSKPVLPHKKELEYLPTQYLCEMIKDNKFNGIVFKSSLEKGDNYVFFDDSFLKGINIETFVVTDISIKFNKK